MKLRNFLILFLGILVPFISLASDEKADSFQVKQLSEDWLVYNQEYQALVPLLDGSSEDNSIHQWVDLDKFLDYNLNFKAAPGLVLLINQKIVYKNVSNNTENVKIKISEIPSRINKKQDLVSFYHASGKLPLNSTFIGHDTFTSHAESGIELIARNIHDHHQIALVLFILILLLFTILKNLYPKTFNDFFNFSKAFPSISGEYSNLSDPLSISSVFFILFNSMCLTLLLVIINDRVGFFELIPFLRDIELSSFFGLVFLTLFIILVYLLKYIYLVFVGWVYNVPNLVKIQYFELLKTFSKVNLLAVLVIFSLAYSNFLNFQFNYNNFYFIVFLCLFIVIIRIGFLIFRITSFRYLYLFSYLCTTEILPLVIIIKIIMF